MTPEERDLYIRTIIGEAGGEGVRGMFPVAHVIMNRVKAGNFGDGVSEVILKPKQFSVWNKGDPAGYMARNVATTDPLYRQAGVVVDQVEKGSTRDPTGGATHFYDPKTSNPAWGPNLRNAVQIGSHRFGVDPSTVVAQSSLPPEITRGASGAFPFEGSPVRQAYAPGQVFGQDATAGAKPFNSIITHWTGGNLQSALNTLKGDPSRGGASYGYHFYVDTDGTIIQGAPLDARTNRVEGPGGAHRTTRPDIRNSNAIGIAFVGTGTPTPAQLEAAKRFQPLIRQFNIPAENILGHGEVQSNREPGEGIELAKALRVMAPAALPREASQPPGDIPATTPPVAPAATAAPSLVPPASPAGVAPLRPQGPNIRTGGPIQGFGDFQQRGGLLGMMLRGMFGDDGSPKSPATAAPGATAAPAPTAAAAPGAASNIAPGAPAAAPSPAPQGGSLGQRIIANRGGNLTTFIEPATGHEVITGNDENGQSVYLDLGRTGAQAAPQSRQAFTDLPLPRSRPTTVAPTVAPQITAPRDAGGPQMEDVAFPPTPPPDDPNPVLAGRVPGATTNTKLNPLEELAFRQFVKDGNVPFNPFATKPQDYDMRGFFKAGSLQQDPRARTTENLADGRIHYPDYWKTPQHSTFSNESQWAPADAPAWGAPPDRGKLMTLGGRVLHDENAPLSPFSVMAQPQPNDGGIDPALQKAPLFNFDNQLPFSLDYLYPPEIFSGFGSYGG